jgi:hypothetical protein
MSESRSNVVSSFTIIKGSLIEETYIAFQSWDLNESKADNLTRIKENNITGAQSTNWLRDVVFVLNRRFDPEKRDRPLIELAQAGCDRSVWKPLLLWHITRDEFLLRDFLVNWLYERYIEGIYRIKAEELHSYLKGLQERSMVEKDWTYRTTKDVASSLFRMAVDFDLMTGKAIREFSSYHLPDESFLYLLYAIAEVEQNARQIIESPEWHMFLMDSSDVERELLRLHQYRKIHYEAAGSLAQLELPYGSLADYVRELAA